MDYWCALWFWSYDDTISLPTREEYWKDIEALLAVDNDRLDRRTRLALERTGKGMLAEDDTEFNRITDEEAQIVARTQEELLTEARGSRSLFADDDPMRFKIVARLSERYHFFHPMLEFLEVFWLRDGFDIICGNPPWLKLEFDEQGIISEKYPEIAIRKISAPQARTMRENFFTASPQLKKLYNDEELENAGSAAFTNAYCNYPLLEGQQTNLYKCVLENGFTMLSDKGYMGLLHPEGVYDDPNGQPLRKDLYRRLRYHFQYQNAFNLFPIGHREKYGTSIYGGYQDISFYSINNLFTPQTIDSCFAHNGYGICGGIKINGEWNTAGHHDRIVHITEKELKVMADTFEQGAEAQSAKLVSIHTTQTMEILKAFAAFPKHVGEFKPNIQECYHETGAVDSGIIKRETFYPNVDNYEMVYNGPQIYVSNPSYKTPKSICNTKADYDTIDLTSVSAEYIARSNYRPIMPLAEYKKQVQGFYIGQDSMGNATYDNWIDYYKVGFRKMINLSGERSLICAVLPRRTAHIHGVISATFSSRDNTVDMAALCASLPLDFFMKTIAAQNLTSVRMQGFPLGVDKKYNSALRSRCLRLNCVTNHYAELWQEVWNPAYREETWSINDPRLAPWDTLTEQWNHDIPLRNYFARRQALVEIDVVAAMALGLTLDELIMMYKIQFPVLQQNEQDTWYDVNGQIVFTCSKGLTGVGLDRKGTPRSGILGWEDIRGEAISDEHGNFIGYQGTTPTYTHTIDSDKSELYGGQKQTFVAPYTKCDRIADYRTAWAHFEKIFNK